jgi:hypothetical protein
MTGNIHNTSRHIEPARTTASSSAPIDNGNLPNNVFDVMMRATPCSPMVFYGLLAWANLNAQMSAGHQGSTLAHPVKQ